MADRWTQELQDAAKAKRLVRIERARFPAEFAEGVPLAVGSDLVLLALVDVDHFRPNGYGIFRLADVSDVRSDEYERFMERVLEAEGTPADRLEAPGVRIDDWRHAALDAVRNGELVIVEAEESQEDEFWLGRIADVDEDGIWLLPLGALGEWDHEAVAITYGEITQMRFRERYAEVYARYASPPPE
jgi:hypothetical protein